MMVSVFLFSLMHLAIKAIPNIPVHEVISFRSLFSFVICLYLLKKSRHSFWGNNKRLLIFRGLVGTASLFAFFYAIRLLPLATAVTISNLIPLFTLLLAAVFLQEKIYWQNWLFFFISFTGVLLIKGFDPRVTTIGLIAALSAALFTAMAHFTVRKLRDTEFSLVIVFYFPLVTIPLVVPYTATHFVVPVGMEWWMLLAIGVCTHVGQVYLTKAYRDEEVSGVSNVYFIGIVLALMYGVLFYSEHLNWAGYLGIGFICAGIALNYYFRNSLHKQ
jgi:drug/metabolite transporter (DMT)-like permease